MSLRDQLLRAGSSSPALASFDRQRDEDADRPSSEEELALGGDRLLGAPGAMPRADGHARLLRDAAPQRDAVTQESLLRLNRRYGNRYVNRVLKTARSAGNETALYGRDVVGAPDDRHEREADRVAARLTGALRQSGDGRQAAGADGPASAPRAPSHGGGHLLPEPLRQSAERAFGADFGAVRVHTDAAAASQSEGVQARAFTRNSDLFFAAGEYAPHTPGGQALLAHELAHVVQQTGDPAERARAGVSAADGGVIQRRLKGAAEDLKDEAGGVSQKAKAKGKLTLGIGKSTYARIIEALEEYEKEEDNVEKGEPLKIGDFYVGLLQKIIDLINQWFASNAKGPSETLRPEDAARGDALERLRNRVRSEQATVAELGGPDIPLVRQWAAEQRASEARAQARAQDRSRGILPAGATPIPQGAEGGGRQPPPSYPPPQRPRVWKRPLAAAPGSPGGQLTPSPTTGATAAGSKTPSSRPSPSTPPKPAGKKPRSPHPLPGPGWRLPTPVGEKARSPYAEVKLPRAFGRPEDSTRGEHPYVEIDIRKTKALAEDSRRQAASPSGPPVPERSAVSLGGQDERAFRRETLEAERETADKQLKNAQTRLKETEDEQRAFLAQGGNWPTSHQYRDARGRSVGAAEFYRQQIEMLRRAIGECTARKFDIDEELEDMD